MTAGELLAIIRADYMDDVVEPYNWPDTQLLREIGRAQQQACYRQDLRHLHDEFSLTLEAGTRSYELDPSVLRIDEVSLNGKLLEFTTRNILDERYRGWRNYSAGVPKRFYIIGRTLYLDRASSANEDGLTLAVQAWREPLILPQDLAADDDLEWTNDVEQLAHWVAFRAFMRRDEDTQDKEKASEHLALFNATFGVEVPAQVRAELLMYPAEFSFAPASSIIEREDW